MKSSYLTKNEIFHKSNVFNIITYNISISCRENEKHLKIIDYIFEKIAQEHKYIFVPRIDIRTKEISVK